MVRLQRPANTGEFQSSTSQLLHLLHSHLTFQVTYIPEFHATHDHPHSKSKHSSQSLPASHDRRLQARHFQVSGRDTEFITNVGILKLEQFHMRRTLIHLLLTFHVCIAIGINSHLKHIQALNKSS
jgi:hypothetical protein